MQCEDAVRLSRGRTGRCGPCGSQWMLGIMVSFIGFAPVHALSDLPNIIVIVTDDQGVEAVSGPAWPHDNGYDLQCRTPNLALLSEQAVVFTNFRTNPYCSPTRAGLMTGRHPCVTGVTHVVNPGKQPLWVRDRVSMQTYEPTVAELLRDSGYHTILIDKWHCGNAASPQPADAPAYYGAQLPNDQGFVEPYDSYEDNVCIEKGDGPDYCKIPYPQCTCGDPACDDAHNWTTDIDRMTSAADEAVVQAQSAPGPYAMFFHTIDPHQRATDCFDRNWWRINAQLLEDPSLYYDDEDRLYENERNRYRAVVEGIDSTIRSMLTNLGVIDTQGAYVPESNTIVFFLGDNGTPSFANEANQGAEFAVSMYSDLPNEYTYRGHAKGTVYEGGIHAPLFVFGAGISDNGNVGPMVVDRLTSYVDLYDTIADVVDAAGGTPSPRGALPRAGRSFAYYLGYSSVRNDHEVTVSGLTIRRHDNNVPEEIHRVAVTDGLYKLVIDTTAPYFRPLRDGQRVPKLVEFYDLFADPEEINDLADGPVPDNFYRLWDRVVDQWPTAVSVVDGAGQQWLEVGIPVDGVYAIDSNNTVTRAPRPLPVGYAPDGTETRIVVKFQIASLYTQLLQAGKRFGDITSAQLIFRIHSDSTDVWQESWDVHSPPPPYASIDADTGPIRAYPMKLDPFVKRNLKWDRIKGGHDPNRQVGVVDLPPHLLYDTYAKLKEHGYYNSNNPSTTALSGPQYPPGTPVSMGRSTSLVATLQDWKLSGTNYGVVLMAEPLDFDGDELPDGDQRVFLQMDDVEDIRLRISFVK